VYAPIISGQRPKALLTALADNHVKVVGKVQKNMMVAYMESYHRYYKDIDA